MVKPDFLQRYGSSKVLKTLFWLLVDFLSAVLLGFLYLLLPLKKIKFFLFMDDKIGHLNATDLFLRQIQNGTIQIETGTCYVGIANSKPPNRQLVKMLERKLLAYFKNQLKIIKLQQPDFVQATLRAFFSKNSLFGKSIFYQQFSGESYFVPEYSAKRYSILSFTPDEEKRGKFMLRKMGIKGGAWFICFEARDSEYLRKTSKSDEWRNYTHRDCNIDNYLKAAKYIVSKGGYAVRMGSIVGKKLPNLKNRKIIDYASKYRNDFMDIYLTAKCKFFLGSTSGLAIVSTMFGRPVAPANVIPISYPPPGKDDLFIPKKIWSKKYGRFLTFSEMISFKEGGFIYTKDFEKAGLVPTENTPEEIFSLVKEMNKRIDGKLKYAVTEEKLQNKFKSVFKSSFGSQISPYRYQARIGSNFLRENKELLK